MKSILSIIIAFFLLFNNQFLFAQSLQEKKENLKKEAQIQRQLIDEANEKLSDVSEKMRLIYDDWLNATNEYNKINEELEAANNKLDELEIAYKENEEKLQNQINLLKKRVRDIYIHGQISYLDILFGAQDFNDFMNRINIIKRILNYDYNLIKSITENKKSIEENKIKQEEVRNEIQKLHDTALIKKEVLDDKKNTLEEMEDQLLNDRATAQKAYEELEAASREVQRMIEQRANSGVKSSVVGTGQMMWPINGEITSPYGWRVHPIFGHSIFHSGLDIGGDYGDPIRAADSGVVSYSGWIRGYGYTVMIDHGNGIVTLYGHNQELAVSVGQRIEKGEIIAYCGSTGNSTGPHCHFEVRVNGQTVNPLNYL